MTWNEFFKSIKGGETARIYLFTGPEEWLKREALDALRALLLPPGLEQLNDSTLEGATAQQIIDAAETMPMMCEKRIVTVRDWAPMMPGKSKNEEAEAQRIQAWLANPPESCVAVFYLRSEPDGRKKATSMLRKAAVVVQFDPLSDSELARWCAQRLKPFSKSIEPQALHTLSFMAGRDLTRLSGELEKLTAYVGDRETIQEADVRALVSASLEYNVFELINRLLEGDLGEAQRMAARLLQGGQNAVSLLAMLTRQLRQLAHMRQALDAGDSVESVQTLLKLHPYAAKQTAKQSRTRSADAFKALYQRCVQTDFEIKSGQLRDAAALDAILWEIAAPALAQRRN